MIVFDWLCYSDSPTSEVVAQRIIYDILGLRGIARKGDLGRTDEERWQSIRTGAMWDRTEEQQHRKGGLALRVKYGSREEVIPYLGFRDQSKVLL